MAVIVYCVDIDPDGDTLIILPFTKTINEAGFDAHTRCSIACRVDVTETESIFSDGEETSNLHLETEDSIKSKGFYRFKVSMKQLSLASPRAKSVLQGPFRESMPKADGLRHWTFEPIFDPEAFTIVMSILHAQFSNVPYKVSLEMLSNIALIADDLKCRDSVYHFVKLWIKELDQEIQEKEEDDKDLGYDGIDCARNIFVSLFFGLKERLRWAGDEAIRSSPDISSSYGLPIPSQILKILSQHRLSMLQKAVKKLEAVIKETISSNWQCFICRSAAAGALMANISINGYSAEDISAHSDKIPWNTFCKTVRDFKWPEGAACRSRTKPHVDLKESVSHCLRHNETSKLDLDQC